MNVIELDRALRKLRLSGIAQTLETRLLEAQTNTWTPLDLVSALVSDELVRREDRLICRRVKQAGFRDSDRRLDNFDFDLPCNLIICVLLAEISDCSKSISTKSQYFRSSSISLRLRMQNP